MNETAFTTAVSLSVRTTTAPLKCNVSRRVRAAPRAVLSGDKRAFAVELNGNDENAKVRRDSEYRGPQGFTGYAEKVNGRMAMIGFALGLVTEVLTGKSIGDQMLIMFSPLLHFAHSFLVLLAHAEMPPVM